MIRITHFTSEPENLSALLSSLYGIRFNIRIEWYYNSDTELNVDITVKGTESNSIENIICSLLSAKQIQYLRLDTLIQDEVLTGKHTYLLTPICDKKESTNRQNLSPTSIYILLTCIWNTQGRFIVDAEHSGNDLKAYMCLICNNDYTPYETKFVFGSEIKISTNKIINRFDITQRDNREVLTLPYYVTNSNSLVNGFGSKQQASQVVQSSDVILGKIFDDPLHRSLCFTLDNWRSSTYVLGAPGYGKSTFINSLLYQTWKKQHIPFIVVEPKREYRCLKRLIPEMKVIRTLRGINPLIPPTCVNPYDYAEVLLQLIELSESIPSDSPLPSYYRETYYKAIEENNYNMDDFIKRFRENMSEKEFQGEAINFIISGENRLENFFRIFGGIDYRKYNNRPFGITKYLNVPTVIEVGNISTQKMLSVFTYFVISQLKLKLNLRKSSNSITNILVLEEAHSVLTPELNSTVRTDIINLIAEGRAKGLSVIICDQSPNRLDQCATDLCGNSISFRLLSTKDREYVKAQLDCSSNDLNDMRKRCCRIRTNGMRNSETISVNVDEEILNLTPITDIELKEMNH